MLNVKKNLLITGSRILLICSTTNCVADSSSSQIRNVSLSSNYSDKIIFQLENSIYRNAFYQSYALTWYSSNNLEIGLQSLNHHLSGVDFQTFEKDSYLTISKSFEDFLFSKLDLSIGTAIGTNFDEHPKQLHLSNYLDLSSNLNDNWNVRTGLLYANHIMISSNKDEVNFHVGSTYRNEYISASIDFYSGENSMSGIMSSVSFRKVFDNLRPYVGIRASVPYEWSNVSASIGFTYKLF